MSKSRTLKLPVDVCGLLNQQLSWATAKTPDDVLDFSVDYSAWLAADGGTIIAIQATAANGLIIVRKPSVPNAQGLVTIRLGGGIDGQTYGVNLRAFLATGEVLSRTIYLPVRAITGADDAISAALPTVRAEMALSIGNSLILIGGTPVFIAGRSILSIGGRAITIGHRPIFLERP